MELDGYKDLFNQAQADLEKLMEEREALDRKISKVKQAILGLAPLAEMANRNVLENIVEQMLWGPEFAAMGITDAIREILKTSEKPLTPMEVRERLLQTKPSVKEQVNLMASIHTVLKRLVPKEATKDTNADGDITYAWVRRGFYKAALDAVRENYQVSPPPQLPQILKKR
jgi:hypothetical protein